MKLQKSKQLNALIALLLIAIIYSCSPPKPALLSGEGYLEVTGGKIWYNVTGEGDKTPIIVLHGGPGAPHYYLKNLQALGTDRKVIFYDQLGCGKSDRNNDTTLMTVDHYVMELQALTHHLGLRKFYLYGHSWGTMLGLEYYLGHKDEVKGLILNSPALSIPMWIKDANVLLATLPDSIQESIRVDDSLGNYESESYQNSVMAFYSLYLCRSNPWPADVDSTFSQIGESYVYMCGHSEFNATGTLKNYDRTETLKTLRVPTLYITGEFDEARPETVKYYQSLTPGAQYAEIPGAGHLTTIDNPDATNSAIRSFIEKIEMHDGEK